MRISGVFGVAVECTYTHVNPIVAHFENFATDFKLAEELMNGNLSDLLYGIILTLVVRHATNIK